MRRLLFTAATFALFGSPALACINDRESLKAEREFKSQYQEKPAAPSASPTEPSGSGELLTYGAGGAGVVLLVGAFALGIVSTRKPR